ncbi:MAG: hypothetical protein R2707_06245 [Acidimicrobiales bacterium]
MTTAYDAPHDELEGRYWSPTRIALALVVLLITAMWVWIYLWAPRSNPDRLDTRAFADAAQEWCEPFAADLDALPITTTDTTIAQRAINVAEGTRLTVAMVEGLKAEAAAVTDENDVQLLTLWFDDWDAYVADREAYVELLRDAPADADRKDLAFTLTERAAGGIYTRTIDGFAEVNDMASCAVPRDI